MSVYSRSFPLLSFHLRYITEASTLAGENVLGSFSSEITLRRMVLAINKHEQVRAETGQQLPASQQRQQSQCHSAAASHGSGGEPGAGPPARVYLSKVEQARQETAVHGLSGSHTFPCKLPLFFNKAHSPSAFQQPLGTSCRLWEQKAVPNSPLSHPCPQTSLLPAAPSPRSPYRTFWVGFHRSDGSSPLCGSSTGGWRMEMQTSPV